MVVPLKKKHICSENWLIKCGAEIISSIRAFCRYAGYLDREGKTLKFMSASQSENQPICSAAS